EPEGEEPGHGRGDARASDRLARQALRPTQQRPIPERERRDEDPDAGIRPPRPFPRRGLGGAPPLELHRHRPPDGGVPAPALARDAGPTAPAAAPRASSPRSPSSSA